MKHIARVTDKSRDRDRTHEVEAEDERALVGTCASTRSIERSNGAVRRAYETVSHGVRVKVVSRNCPSLVDG